MRASTRRLAFAPLLSGVVLLGTGMLTPLRAQSATCSEYDSQVWAQSVYETDRTAYAALDPDGNGMACDELPLGAAPAWWTTEVPAGAQLAELDSVTDGDTIRVLVDGVVESVQLLLVDAPGTTTDQSDPECYGQEASNFLTWLLTSGGTLYLERDAVDRNDEGRLLRYAWLDVGDGAVYQVNEAMVRSGFAAISTEFDGTYEEKLWAATSFAREHGYGLWGACMTDADGDTNDLV
jgi:endonuclease YncB( thermonuclease family)